MSRGALIYAHNNEAIDYVKLAAINAKLIKYNLNIGTTLVSDTNSIASLPNVETYFENILLTDLPSDENPRVYKNASEFKERLSFKNMNHWSAHELSPYDETLFIDADYLILSDSLSKCWESNHSIMISSDATDLANSKHYYRHYVSPLTIKMFWATCVYFKKDDVSRMLFDMVKSIYDNYEFYVSNYLLSNSMFRNDFAFSIAIHILNGSKNGYLTAPLPNKSILTSYDTDKLYKFNDINDITIIHPSIKNKNKFLLSRLKDSDVHIMNKFSLLKEFDKIMELYE